MSAWLHACNLNVLRLGEISSKLYRRPSVHLRTVLSSASVVSLGGSARVSRAAPAQRCYASSTDVEHRVRATSVSHLDLVEIDRYLFRAPREDNFFGATAFAFFAGLAGFAVPIDVGGERLAYVATSGEVPRGAYLSAETGSKAATYADGFDDGLISPEGQNDQLAARLWDRSRELVNI